MPADCCDLLPVREATDQELLFVHTQDLINAVATLSGDGAYDAAALSRLQYHIAADTLGNKHTHTAARLAAGTAAEMTQRVVRGEAANGFAVIRPAGMVATLILLGCSASVDGLQTMYG